MLFWDRVKMAAAVLRGAPRLDLPESGRSSDETFAGAMSAFTSAYGSISPVVNFEMLKTLKCLWLYNPDFSQYIANIVNLGNPGHSIAIEAATDAKAQQAADRIDEAARRLFPQGCGVDGLIGQYLTSVAWSGAISSEDVVNLAAARVEKVVLVPVEQIRFKYNKDLDTYEAYQRSNNLLRSTDRSALDLIKLNPETYKYFALSTVENSPYAKPPATAVVDPILKGQEPLLDNLRYIAQKFGLLGFVTAMVTPPPPIPGKTAEETRADRAKYLAQIAKVLEGSMSKGMVATFNDTKLENTKTNEGAAGLYDLNRISEEQVMSALGQPPAFFGRTDSTTETYADVVWHLLQAQVAGMQRIVKRRQEATYMLDLRLAGMEVDGVSLTFDPVKSRNAKAEAETDQIRFQDVLARVKSGVITPDDGAHELGYDSWADPAMLSVDTGILPQQSVVSNSRQTTRRLTLSFDRASQRYRHKPDRYEIWSGGEEGEVADNVIPLQVKKKASHAGA